MLNQVLAEDNVNGRFSDDDLHLGTRGTRIEAREQNAIFFEIRNAVAAAGITLNGEDETQLAQAIVAIARREGGMNALHVQMQHSPQRYDLTDLGVPVGQYALSLSLVGRNDQDITLSYELAEGYLTLYSWYTNEEGKRTPGLPTYAQGGWFGKSFGRSFNGSASGANLTISLLLTAIK